VHGIHMTHCTPHCKNIDKHGESVEENEQNMVHMTHITPHCKNVDKHGVEDNDAMAANKYDSVFFSLPCFQPFCVEEEVDIFRTARTNEGGGGKETTYLICSLIAASHEES